MSRMKALLYLLSKISTEWIEDNVPNSRCLLVRVRTVFISQQSDVERAVVIGKFSYTITVIESMHTCRLDAELLTKKTAAEGHHTPDIGS